MLLLWQRQGYRNKNYARHGQKMIQRFVIVVLLCGMLMPMTAMGAAPQQGFSVGEARIRAAVSDYIQQKTANLGWEVRLKRLAINGNPLLPEGPLDIEVMAPQQWEGWGSANLGVVVRQRDRVVLNLSAQAEVEALAEMVVTLRQLDYGTIISSADIAVQKRDITTVGGKYARSVDMIVGKRARTTIKANAAVRTDQVEKVPVIKSGQLVTIVAENEVMKITVAGKARSAGAEGDIIMVQNLNSLKEIPAKVLNATTVQVSF